MISDTPRDNIRHSTGQYKQKTPLNVLNTSSRFRPALRSKSMRQPFPMESSIVQSFGYRNRRSALIPNNVSLSPEDELLIAHRIGYRPVPPPGAMESQWFTTITNTTWGPKPTGPQGNDGQHDDDKARTKALMFRGQFDDESGWRLPLKVNRIRSQVLGNTDSPEIPDQSEIRPSRQRRTSWKIDIPHMSEIQPLRSRSLSLFPSIQRPQRDYVQYGPVSWKAASVQENYLLKLPRADEPGPFAWR